MSARESGPSAERKTQSECGNRQQIGLAKATVLDELSESIASAKDHAIEMLFREPQLATDIFPVLVVEVEPHQDLAIPWHRHLFQHSPRSGGPLTTADTLPVRIVLRSRKLIEGIGAGEGAAILAAMVAQVVERDAVEVSAEVLGMGNLSRAQLLERRNGGVLQDVRRDFRIAHPPQYQCTKTGEVTIDCSQVRNGVRYWRR